MHIWDACLQFGFGINSVGHGDVNWTRDLLRKLRRIYFGFMLACEFAPVALFMPSSNWQGECCTSSVIHMFFAGWHAAFGILSEAHVASDLAAVMLRRLEHAWFYFMLVIVIPHRFRCYFCFRCG